MKKLQFNLGLLAMTIILMAAIVWIGCTKSPVSSEASKDLSALSLTSYFPLTTGTNLDFRVIDNSTNDTTRQRYIVGGTITYSNTQAIFQWISLNVDHPFYADTGYLCLDNGILYYYDNLYMRPEAILSTPFEVGKSWQRYGTSKGILDSGMVVDINNNYYYIKYDDTGLSGNNNNGLGDYNPYDNSGPINNDGGSYKNFPSSGSNCFGINTIEDITMSSGITYGDCIKVGSENGDYNYSYWYAPNVGLVKYVLGQNTNDYPDGRIVGERVPGWNY